MVPFQQDIHNAQSSDTNLPGGVMKQVLYFLLVLIWTLAGGIGGCAKTVQPGKPFSDSERRFFDDSIDVVEDINALQGQFGFEAREDVDARSNLADVIAVVEILSVNSSVGANSQKEMRLDVQVKEILYGEVTANQIQLRSNANALGYRLLERHQAALNGTKVLFMRTFPLPNAAPGMGHHFHLSPNSPSVRKEVAHLLKKRLEAESGKDKKRKSDEE